MRRRLHRLRLSLLLTAGVIVWQQQESSRSAKHLPFPFTAQTTTAQTANNHQVPEKANRDSDLRAFLKAVQPLQLLNHDEQKRD
ncbi:MAG: hypothetical protein EDM05_013545 [Leptolyngbya sp. IPPAS B-1204]|nr:MAG: hypothetical protein EDM05_02955 [Leptolyngbya sp. IPPAS B-1204]